MQLGEVHVTLQHHPSYRTGDKEFWGEKPKRSYCNRLELKSVLMKTKLKYAGLKRRLRPEIPYWELKITSRTTVL